MICGKTFLYLYKKINGRSIFAFIPARCKSWSCNTCRAIKARIVREYIKANFTSNNLFMITLTFYHSGTALEAWENVGPCWNRMRTYITKRFGKFNYLRIVEPHKDGGWPHLHVLIDGYILDTEIIKRVTEWGFGWNFSCVRVHPDSVANYLSKYLTKPWPAGTAEFNRVASKCRIVSVSRGMPAIFTKESEWECVKYDCQSDHTLWTCNSLIKICQDLKADYILVKKLGEGFIIETSANLTPGLVEKFTDPYVWNICGDYDYEYIRYGLQMVLKL